MTPLAQEGDAVVVDEQRLSTGQADSVEYNAFLAGISLQAIELASLRGERRAAGDAPLTKFESEAAYQVGDNALYYRFDVHAHLTDETDTDYGEVSASVIVSIEVKSIPAEACLERFGGTSAAMMAHPYLREALANTALRMGFQGVLLPTLVQQPEAGDD